MQSNCAVVRPTAVRLETMPCRTEMNLPQLPPRFLMRISGSRNYPSSASTCCSVAGGAAAAINGKVKPKALPPV
jgi:hypothetical protein